MTNTSNKTSFTIGITPVNSTNCVTKIYEKKTTHLTYKLKIMASIRHNNKKNNNGHRVSKEQYERNTKEAGAILLIWSIILFLCEFLK